MGSCRLGTLFLVVLSVGWLRGQITPEYPPVLDAFAAVLPKPKSAIAEYRGYSEADVKVFRKGQQITATQYPGGHFNDITVVVTAFHRTFTLELHINRYLFSSSYAEKSLTVSGHEYNDVNHMADHCYYTGKVNGLVNTSAALSTCSGVKGYFMYEDETYNVEPVDGTLTGQHRVYRESDSLVPEYKCGHNSTTDSRYKFMENLRKKRAFNWPQGLDGQIKVIELFVVNDNAHYRAQGSNLSTVISRTKEIVNVASSLFQSVDIHIALTGVEVWTSVDLIDVVGANDTATLNRFCSYRRNNINHLHPNDNSQLLTGVFFNNGVVGLAYVGTMCSFSSSCGQVTDFSVSVSGPGTVMAHEMGHNLGLIHDTQYLSCSCDDPNGKCIMYPETSNRNPSTHWSQCSKDRLRMTPQYGLDYCLYNIPDTLYDQTAACGNGIVDAGEDCDCGNAPATECNRACCDASTCRLKAPATCAYGRCCDINTCQLKPLATPCREATNRCDLTEYCSGQDAQCPSNAYQQNGAPCTDSNDVDAYCYGGECRSHLSQCQLWWGSSAKNGIESCYTYFNVQGDLYGHCGYDFFQNAYYKCSSSDALCGLLHCSSSPYDRKYFKNYEVEVFIESLASDSNCTAASYYALNSGPDRPDPGLVPNGAKCGIGKMCHSQKCVDVSTLSVTPCPDCHQHGVCNNLGQCHCDAPYSPPDCSQPGLGGSNHSNAIIPDMNATIPPPFQFPSTTTPFEVDIPTIHAGPTTTTASSPGSSSSPMSTIIIAAAVGGGVLVTIVIIAVIARVAAGSRSAARGATAAVLRYPGPVMVSSRPPPVAAQRQAPAGRFANPTDEVRLGVYPTEGNWYQVADERGTPMYSTTGVTPWTYDSTGGMPVVAYAYPVDEHESSVASVSDRSAPYVISSSSNPYY